MQLSIQANAQKQAKSLIQSWGKQAGVQIENVRYHLLRNGLILQNIRVERGQNQILIKHIFVRANPKLLTGSTPRIGSVNIAGVSAVIRTDDHNAWQEERPLQQIWQAATSLTLRDGQIKLYLKGTDAPPVVLSEF
ncbi:MAG: hypothetical protein ACE5DZ_08800, partial [Mariprofundus sp.]